MILRAETVWPLSAPPLRPGAVAVREGRIAAIGLVREVQPQPEEPVWELGEALILPGWVNAHCHLELSHLCGRVPYRGRFTTWLRDLVLARWRWPPEEWLASARTGCAELLRHGVTTVGDITFSGAGFAAVRESGLRGVVFQEVLGFRTAEAERAWAQRTEPLWRERAFPCERVQLGLSPHAPYSTSAALYERCLEQARQHGWLLATHLAETLAEEEFMRTGRGELRKAMQRFHQFDRRWRPPGASPVAYLQELGFGTVPGLAVHCNYLSDEDIGLLQQSHLTVVYCPRSHTFFQHRDHPVERLLAAGVPVALGTDSLASNDRLDLLAEVREAARKHPGVPPETWLRLATLEGARALGWGGETGSLEVGKAADLVAIRGPAGSLSSWGDGKPERAVAEALVGEEHEVVLTMVAGEVKFEREGWLDWKRGTALGIPQSHIRGG